MPQLRIIKRVREPRNKLNSLSLQLITRRMLFFIFLFLSIPPLQQRDEDIIISEPAGQRISEENPVKALLKFLK